MLVIDLCRASGFDQLDALADVAGSLGADGPERAEGLTWDDGPDTALRYRLA